VWPIAEAVRVLNEGAIQISILFFRILQYQKLDTATTVSG
jgi:hypothetical protein